ncbi:MAG TPA: FMN-binding negative transcriptional regulator [Acidimicrobiales bacterium]|nr:FMN-binding negative transcriptional regulator [Acidimicrobiales bacterium]
MFVPPADRTLGEHEWRPWVAAQGFGQVVAAGPDGWPVVVPTQFVLEGDEVLFHVAAANPLLAALAADARAVLAVAGDWAFVPSAWKAVGDDDPLLGIPTTYYAAVQLRGRATVLDDPADVAAVLRTQLAAIQPGLAVADPAEAHGAQLRGIRAVRLSVGQVVAKFKYGGNVDAEHRRGVAERLDRRAGPGDGAAAAHLRRRSAAAGDPV